MDMDEKIHKHNKLDKGIGNVCDSNDIGAQTYNVNQICTFKDLKPNEYFIALPTPGDNRGHGGYLGEHHVFKKINATQALRYHLNPIKNLIFNFEEFKRNYDKKYKENTLRMSPGMQVIKVD